MEEPMTPEQIANWFKNANLIAIVQLQTELAKEGVSLSIGTATIEVYETDG